MLKVMRTSLLTGVSMLCRIGCLLVCSLLMVSALAVPAVASGTDSAALTLADSIPPAAPTGLTAQAIDGTVKLKWNANTETDLKAYSIFRGVGGAQPVRLAKFLPPSVTEYIDDTLEPGLLTVTYQISVLDASANESPRSAPVTLFTLDQIPPAAPTGLAAQAIDGTIKLTWNANTEKDLSIYSIFRAVRGSVPVKLGITVPRGTTEFVDTTLEPGLREYTYQITAFDFGRNESARSAAVTVSTLDSIPPAAPTGLAAKAIDGSIKLTWNANTERDLSIYSIFRAIKGSAPLKFVTTVSRGTTEFLDNTLEPGINEYTYQISARDIGRNESPRSAEVTVSTQDNIPPATPVNFSGFASGDQAIFTWTANTEKDVSAYLIYKFTNGIPATFPLFTPHPITFAVDFDLRHDGSVYIYQITARDLSGNESVRSLVVVIFPFPSAGLSVFPNPSTGPVTIQLPEAKTAALTIRSVSNGALVYQGTYDRETGIKLDLGHVPKGTYIVEVQQDGRLTSTRLQID